MRGARSPRLHERIASGRLTGVIHEQAARRRHTEHVGQLIAILSGYFLYRSGSITIGTVYLLISYTNAIFQPLRDPKVFEQVKLIDDAGCLEWPTGADFDPETLRNWPTYRDEIIAERQRRFAVHS